MMHLSWKSFPFHFPYKVQMFLPLCYMSKRRLFPNDLHSFSYHLLAPKSISKRYAFVQSAEIKSIGFCPLKIIQWRQKSADKCKGWDKKMITLIRIRLLKNLCMRDQILYRVGHLPYMQSNQAWSLYHMWFPEHIARSKFQAPSQVWLKNQNILKIRISWGEIQKTFCGPW